MPCTDQKCHNIVQSTAHQVKCSGCLGYRQWVMVLWGATPPTPLPQADMTQLVFYHLKGGKLCLVERGRSCSRLLAAGKRALHFQKANRMKQLCRLLGDLQAENEWHSVTGNSNLRTGNLNQGCGVVCQVVGRSLQWCF